MIVFPLKDNAIITFIYTVFSNGLNKDFQKIALYVVKNGLLKIDPFVLESFFLLFELNTIILISCYAKK